MSTELPGTALLIPVPEAETVVERWRLLFDPSALHGVPPHITLIFPFIASDHCDTSALANLREIFLATPRFEYRLSQFGQFPGVLYVTPRPEAPFIALITKLVEHFPEAPPYRGAYPTIIPHLTIAHSNDEKANASIRETVGPSLPIACLAQEVHLMRETPEGTWQLSERFSLGSAAG